jgi:hypothetical protein
MTKLDQFRALLDELYESECKYKGNSKACEGCIFNYAKDDLCMNALIDKNIQNMAKAGKSNDRN